MIDSAAIRVRWETFGSKLDERGRRPPARRAGVGFQGYGAGALDDQSRRGRFGRGAFAGRAHPPSGRRPARARPQRPGTARGVASIGRAGHFRRSDASSGLGIEKLGEAGGGADVDGLPGGDRHGSRGTAQTRLFAPGRTSRPRKAPTMPIAMRSSNISTRPFLRRRLAGSRSCPSTRRRKS